MERRSCARRVLNLSDLSSNALALATCLFSMKSTFFFFLHTQPAVQSRGAAFKISIAHFKKKKKETTIPASLGAAPVDDWAELMRRIRDVWERLCARAMHKAEWHDDLCATCMKTNQRDTPFWVCLRVFFLGDFVPKMRGERKLQQDGNSLKSSSTFSRKLAIFFCP